jgi:hypothetical protein
VIKQDVFVEKKKKKRERGKQNCTAMINEFDPWKEF